MGGPETSFSGYADWEMIARIKKLLEIPLIANGDIKKPEDALRCLSVTGADGVMIGGAFDPWKLGEIDNTVKGINNFEEPNIEQKLLLIIEHLKS